MLRSGNNHLFSSTSANLVAGAAAGCTTLILVYPLHIARTRLAADIGRTQVLQFRVIYHFLTTSAGLISYPLAKVRRRMMMQSGIERPVYHSTLRKIYKTEGISPFYRGAVSNMFRSIGSAAILVLYDEVNKFMNWGR